MIDKCYQFFTLAVNNRWAKVRERGLCFICLRRSHRSVDCKDSVMSAIGGCQDEHLCLLH